MAPVLSILVLILTEQSQISFSGDVTLTDNVELDSGAAIVLSGTVDGQIADSQNLTLIVDNSSVTISGNWFWCFSW